MSEREIASFGEISPEEISHHGKLFEKALKDLDGSKFAQGPTCGSD